MYELRTPNDVRIAVGTYEECIEALVHYQNFSVKYALDWLGYTIEPIVEGIE